jgi:glycosyltransferase involved in cell wall biosynthesis
MTVRVVLVGPVYPYRGGIAHYTARLAKEMSREHDVFVISFKRQYPKWLYPGKTDLDPSALPVMRPDAEYLLDPLNPLTWWRTSRRIRVLHPDRLVIQWWITFWAPAYFALAVLSHKIPLIFLVHNVLPHETNAIHRLLARWALGRGWRFILHTAQENSRLLELLPRSRAFIHPHPTYDIYSALREDRESARRKLNLPQNAYVLLFFGIVRPYKGLLDLLEAFAHINIPGVDTYLLVAGEIWGGKSQYLQKIQQPDVGSRVRFYDRYIPDEEVGLYFSAADVFVAPHRTATQSGAASVALGFGLPLIITDVVLPGIPSEKRDLAMVVPVNDPAAIAQAIRECFDDLLKPKPATSCPAAEWRSLVHLIEAGDK